MGHLIASLFDISMHFLISIEFITWISIHESKFLNLFIFAMENTLNGELRKI